MGSNRRGSYISAQLESINAQLQTLFDDLGVEQEERNIREKKVYDVIAEALEHHVQIVKQERDGLRNKCAEMQQNLKDMASALNDVDLNMVVGPLSEVVYCEVQGPYYLFEKNLNAVFDQLEVIYTQRSNRANELLEELNRLSDKIDGMNISEDLRPPSTKEDLNLSTHYLSRLESEIQRWRNEIQSRLSRVSMNGAQIVALWAELGTSQESIDRNIMNNYKNQPELLGIKLADILRLDSLVQSLEAEKQSRQERIEKLSKTINTLWTKLAEDEDYVRNFESNNRGIGPNVMEAVSRQNPSVPC